MTQTELQTLIDQANENELIMLPDEMIHFDITVSTNCILIGQDNTIFNVSGLDQAITITAPNATVSDFSITSDKNGILMQNSGSSIERVSITAQESCFVIKNSNNAKLEECIAENSKIGFSIKDSNHITFNSCEARLCTTGYDIIGSSTEVGDVERLYENYYEEMFLPETTYSADITLANETFAPSYVERWSGSVVEQNNTAGLPEAVITTAVFKIKKTQETDANFECYFKSHNQTNGAVNEYLGTGSMTGMNENDTVTASLELIKQNGSNTSNIENDIITFNGTYQVDGSIQGSYVANVDLDLGSGIQTYEWTGDFSFTNDWKKENIETWEDASKVSVTTPAHNGHAVLTKQEIVDNLSSQLFGATVDIVNGELQITGYSYVLIEDNDDESLKDLLLLNQNVTEIEAERRDRVHFIEMNGVHVYENTIGIRLINTNNITFNECFVHSNTNIGIWQMPNSYSNVFRGEIYNNTKFGLKNTDTAGNLHDVDATNTWWGARSGPSLFGKGDGDKISSNVKFAPPRAQGTEPELIYPVTRDWIWSMLGYPQVRVELTEEQITQCIDMAIGRYLDFRMPNPTYHYEHIGPGQTWIELPKWLSHSDIIEITYSPGADIFTQLSGSGESFYLTYYLQNTGGTFLSDFYVAMAYRETMETTLGIRPTYEFVSGVNKDGETRDYIRVHPKPSMAISVAILHNAPMTEEEIDNKQWIRKYALTWAKEMLGRIRSKYGSVPSPTGEMQLDGQTLLQEAMQDRQSLEESLLMRSEPLGFTTG